MLVKKLKLNSIMKEEVLVKQTIEALAFPVSEEIVKERMDVLVQRLYF